MLIIPAANRELKNKLVLPLRRKGRAPQIRGRYLRLVIPNLQQYRNQPQKLSRLKGDTLDLLLNKQSPVGLQFYKVAVEAHPTTGIPHLDILLLYKTSRLVSLNRFDYLVKHGHLSRYSKLNAAILEYGDKEDPAPLSNMPTDSSVILKAKQIAAEPYRVLSDQMRKDPFRFNVHEWLSGNKLDQAIYNTTWSKATSLLKHQQQALCNNILHDKPGFQLVTLDHVRCSLTTREYREFTKNRMVYWSILTKLNEIVTKGFNRPHKSKQLLIVSPPNTGKTTLALQIKKYVSVYHMGIDNWFPRYRSGVYRMILWNQFNLKAMPYPQLLNLLEGIPMDLQYKGGSVLRSDNQLIYMTSNMSLQQHICARFKSEQSRALARANLRARIDQIILPQGADLFLFLKLLKPK